MRGGNTFTSSSRPPDASTRRLRTRLSGLARGPAWIWKIKIKQMRVHNLYMSITHFPPARGRNWEAAPLALAGASLASCIAGIMAHHLGMAFGLPSGEPSPGPRDPSPQRSFPPGLKLAGHTAGPRWGGARARDGWRARHALAARPRAATCAPKAARPLLDPIVLGLILTRRRQNPRGSSRGDEPNAGWGAVAVGRIAFSIMLAAVGRRDRATSQISRRRPGGTSRH